MLRYYTGTRRRLARHGETWQSTTAQSETDIFEETCREADRQRMQLRHVTQITEMDNEFKRGCSNLKVCKQGVQWQTQNATPSLAGEELME